VATSDPASYRDFEVEKAPLARQSGSTRRGDPLNRVIRTGRVACAQVCC